MSSDLLRLPWSDCVSHPPLAPDSMAFCSLRTAEMSHRAASWIPMRWYQKQSMFSRTGHTGKGDNLSFWNVRLIFFRLFSLAPRILINSDINTSLCSSLSSNIYYKYYINCAKQCSFFQNCIAFYSKYSVIKAARKSGKEILLMDALTSPLM